MLCSPCVAVSSYQPGLYDRVELMAKDFDGNIVPYVLHHKHPVLTAISFVTTVHASGIESKHIHDLPMTRMSQLFNVDHFIVSQVHRPLLTLT
jgi:hypothetical protein